MPRSSGCRGSRSSSPRPFFGGGFLDKGNWEDAQRYLEKAVALKPQTFSTNLELGEGMSTWASTQRDRSFAAIDPLPIADVLDHEYKREAKQLLADIRARKTRPSGRPIRRSISTVVFGALTESHSARFAVHQDISSIRTRAASCAGRCRVSGIVNTNPALSGVAVVGPTSLHAPCRANAGQA